jgi:hypothetical protein
MRSITLCLVTKGRPKYQDALLRSFENALEHQYVEVFIILNGVPNDTKESFLRWSEGFPNRVRFHFSELNEPSISKFWQEIISVQTEWIMFPSDDDVLDEEFFMEWGRIDQSVLENDAVSTYLNLIDSNGKDRGILREPSYSHSLSDMENSAKAFHECPFLWPGFIIKVDSLPREIPKTRYVSDWWVGLYLIFTGRIYCWSKTVTNYRVHDEQESSVAPMGRKNFEGLTHLGGFIDSEVFTSWVSTQPESELLNFLYFIRKYPPLYGDPKFSSELVSRLASKVVAERNEPSLILSAYLTNAISHEVLLNSNQLTYVIPDKRDISMTSRSFNFSPLVHETVCESVRVMIDSKNSDDFLEPMISIGCLHSSKESSDVILNCSLPNASDSLLDQLLLNSTIYLEKNDRFQARISPFEYKLIRVIRALKRLSPQWLNSLLYRIFKR